MFSPSESPELNMGQAPYLAMYNFCLLNFYRNQCGATQLPMSTGASQEALCPVCGIGFKNHQGLQQHIGKVHCAEKRSFVCSICNKGFKYNHALNFHKKQVHEKATRVKCQYCDKVLYNKYILKKHEKKHKTQKIKIN